MSRPPICTGCVNCHRPLHSSELRCERPLSDRIDPVSGRPADPAAASCTDERAPGRRFFGLGRVRCGPEGRFFVARAEEAAQRPRRGTAKPLLVVK